MRKAANPSWKVDFLLPGIIPRLGCSAEKVCQRLLPPPSSSLPSLRILPPSLPSPPFSWFYRGSSATACRSCGRSRNEPAVSHDFQLKVPPRRGKTGAAGALCTAGSPAQRRLRVNLPAFPPPLYLTGLFKPQFCPVVYVSIDFRSVNDLAVVTKTNK